MSWKRSGGIKQFDGINNLNVNSIVTDDFVMREAYKGTFTISGELFVSEDCSLNANVHVNDTVTVGNDLYVTNRVYIGENESDRRFLDSTSQGLGINLENPVALLDISGSNEHIIHVFSDQSNVKSTLVQNVDKNQGVLLLDTSMGALQWFFPDSTANFIYDASNVEFTVDKDWIAKESLHVLGNTTLDNILLVKQDATIEGDLYVMGAFTLDGGLNLNGDLSMNGNLSVGGESQFNDVVNTKDIHLDLSHGIYWKQHSIDNPILRIRDYNGTEPDSLFEDNFDITDNSLVVDNDLYITGKLYIGGSHNVKLENTLVDGIYPSLRGTDVSHVYLNHGSSTVGGEGLYFYNPLDGNGELQDGFVKISNVDQGKISLRSTGARDVVSLNFDKLNMNGIQTGLVVLEHIETGYSDLSDNYDIVSSHRVSTVDVNSSLENINHIETTSISGDVGSLNTCTIQDLNVTGNLNALDKIDASFIHVQNMDSENVQINELTAETALVKNDLDVCGNAIFYSDIVANEYFRGNHLTLSGDAVIDKDTYIYGNLNAYSDVSINGDIHLSGTLTVNDSIKIAPIAEYESMILKNNIAIGISTIDTDYSVSISGDVSMNGTVFTDSMVVKNTANIQTIEMDGTGSLDLSSSNVKVLYNDTVFTISNETLSYLVNISGDVQSQISAISKNVNVGADVENTFTAKNVYIGHNEYRGDISASTLDISNKLNVTGNSLFSGYVKMDSGDISATNVDVNDTLIVHGNTQLSGNVLVNSRTSIYKGSIDIQGTRESTRDVIQPGSNDGKGAISYFREHKESYLTIKSNITCVGQPVVKYQFNQNDASPNLDKLVLVHEQYKTNTEQFFTDYDTNSNVFNDPEYGDLEVSNEVIGGHIECLSLTPRNKITFSSNTNIEVNDTVYTSNRLKKALDIVNETDDNVNFENLKASSFSLTNNSTTINGNGIVTNSLNAGTGEVSSGSIQTGTINATGQIRADTIIYNYISRNEDISATVDTATASFAIYRNTVSTPSQSGGIVVEQNSGQPVGFIYVNNKPSSDINATYTTDVSDVFFIGKLSNFSNQTEDVTIDQTNKGKLITNIYDSDYVNTDNLYVLNDVNVSNSIIMGNLHILHEPFIVSMKNNAAIDANNPDPETDIEPFIKHTVGKFTDLSNSNATLEILNGKTVAFSSEYSYSSLNTENAYHATTHDFSGNVILHNDLDVSVNMVVYGTADLKSRLDVSGDVSFNRNLDVSGNMIVYGTTDLKNRLDVSGDVSFNSNLDVSGNTIVYGTADLKSRLDVSGDVSFNSNLDVSGNMIVYGTANLKNRLDVSGDVSFNSNLDVSGNTIVYGTADLKSRLDVSGDVSFNSNLDVSGNMIVYGTTDLKNRLDVLGDVSFNRNLDVSGNMIVYGATDLKSRLDVLGDVSFNENLDVSGNMIVYGTTDLKSRLDVSSDVSFNSNLDISGDIKVNNDYNRLYFTSGALGDRINLWSSVSNNQFSIGINNSTTYFTSSQKFDFCHRANEYTNSVPSPSLQIQVSSNGNPKLVSGSSSGSIPTGQFEFCRNTTTNVTTFLKMSSDDNNNTILDSSSNFVLRTYNANKNPFVITNSVCSVASDFDFEVRDEDGINAATVNYLKVDKSNSKVEIMSTNANYTSNDVLEARGYIQSTGLKITTVNSNIVNGQLFSGIDTSNVWLASTGKIYFKTGGINNSSNNVVAIETDKFIVHKPSDLKDTTITGNAVITKNASITGYSTIGGNLTVNGDYIKLQNTQAIYSKPGSIYIGSLPTNIDSIASQGQNYTFGQNCLLNIDNIDTSTGNFNVLDNGNVDHRARANTAIGYNALREARTSHTSTAIGYEALKNAQNCYANNTAIGYMAGGNITTTNRIWNNTFLGHVTGFDNNNNSYHDSTAVGVAALINRNHQVVLGRNVDHVKIPSVLKFSKTSSDDRISLYNGDNITTYSIGVNTNANIGMYFTSKDSFSFAYRNNPNTTTTAPTPFLIIQPASNNALFKSSQSLKFRPYHGSNTSDKLTIDTNEVTVNTKLLLTGILRATTGDIEVGAGELVLSSYSGQNPGPYVSFNYGLGNECIFRSPHTMFFRPNGSGDFPFIITSDTVTCGGSLKAQTIYIGTSGVYGIMYRSTNGMLVESTSITLNGGTIIGTGFQTSSDYRIKENIQTISGDQFTVDELRPVSYTLKANQKPALGFIAHEIQEHVPSAVSGEKDGESMQSVDYNQIIPILVKEIQDLKKRVAYLEQNQK